MLAVIPPRGSVAASVQAHLPEALVAAAGHHLPAPVLVDLGRTLVADVLVCSDHRRGHRHDHGPLGQIPGLRPLDAGGLAQAAAIEAFTAVLVATQHPLQGAQLARSVGAGRQQPGAGPNGGAGAVMRLYDTARRRGGALRARSRGHDVLVRDHAV